MSARHIIIGDIHGCYQGSAICWRRSVTDSDIVVSVGDPGRSKGPRLAIGPALLSGRLRPVAPSC